MEKGKKNHGTEHCKTSATCNQEHRVRCIYIRSVIAQSVAVVFWNVDGLYSRTVNSRIIKFANADVHSTLVKHDIICLAETHCGPNDDVHLQGYQAFSNVRPKSSKAKKHSGGLVIYVKDSLRPGVK